MTSHRLQVNDLLDLLIEDLRAQGRATAREVEGRVALHLRPTLGPLLAGQVRGSTLVEYVRRRRDSGATGATVNRELSYLGRAYSVAKARDLLDYRPHLPLQREAQPRQGFLTSDQVAALAGHLDGPTADVVRFLAATGWRLGEALALRWSEVTEQGVFVSRAKNGEARVFPWTAALRAVIESRRAAGVHGPWVFTREDGSRVSDIYKAWDKAAALAGLIGVKPHDLRRSVARALDCAGVRRQVAMKLMGHRTESVYARYNIVAERDLVDAASRLDAAAGA
jgi:hypothetical protein